MKSKVYFIAAGPSDNIDTLKEKLATLLDNSKVLDVVSSGDRVAAKIHFGEEGNTGFVDPALTGVVCAGIKAKGAKASLSDTNVLYKGRRRHSRDHLKLAEEHGFTKDVTGADIVIPDDTKKNETAEVPIDCKHIKIAKVGRFFIDCDSFVAITHFKGHILTGFGGAIKNLGMGCAMPQGKMAQHNALAPAVYIENCVACGACVKVCPAGALTLKDKISLDVTKCIGCGTCVGVCPTFTLFIDFDAGKDVQEKMAEYAYAVLRNKKKKAAFINFAIKINKECDCWGKENPRIAPDVGIFASLDPVAIDKASYDMVKKVSGKDVFKTSHPDQDGNIQLAYAEKLGIGSTEYELIKL